MERPGSRASAAGIGRSLFFVLLLALAALLGFTVLRGRQPTNVLPNPPKGINVLLIVLDTVRKDHLSCYGYERLTTPHIDAVARDGLLYQRSPAVSNWTLPTHASMLTGQYPTTHGAHRMSEYKIDPKSDQLPPAGVMHEQCDSLAELLQHKGYRTGAVLGNSLNLQRAYQLDQGFAFYDDRCGCAVCRKITRAADPPVPYRRASEITDEAINWLGHSTDQPFFLFLNYMDAHAPYFPPKPYDTQFRDEPARTLERQLTTKPPWPMQNEVWENLRDNLINHKTPVPEQFRSWFVCQYDGEIAYADDQIGRLLDWLRDRGLYDHTLIVLTSDHGESFGEHDLMDHNYALYEPELDVPMIVKLPSSRRSGESVSHPVQHVDVMPTVLDVLGMPVPGGVQGVSMLKPTARDLFVESYVNPFHAEIGSRFKRVQWALYRENLKYIEYSDGQRELYDLDHDPGEFKDLSRARPDDVTVLSQALQACRAAYQPLAPERLPTELRQDALEQIRDLGYLD